MGAVRSGDSVTSSPLSSRLVSIGNETVGDGMSVSRSPKGEGYSERRDRIEEIPLPCCGILVWSQHLFELYHHSQPRPHRTELFQRARSDIEVCSRKDHQVPSIVPSIAC